MSMDVKARDTHYNHEFPNATRLPHDPQEIRDLETNTLEQYRGNLGSTIPESSTRMLFDYTHGPASRRLQSLLASSTLLRDYEKTINKTKQHSIANPARKRKPESSSKSYIRTYLRQRQAAKSSYTLSVAAFTPDGGQPNNNFPRPARPVT